MQGLTRIDQAVEDGELASNRVLRTAMSGAERIHLLGLVSDGGVHSGFAHLQALIELAGAMHVPDLVLHGRAEASAATGGAGGARRVPA